MILKFGKFFNDSEKYNILENHVEEFEDEDEDDSEQEFFFLGAAGYKNYWGLGDYIYIVEKMDNHTVILYDNWEWKNAMGFNILSYDEIENHIFNNETPIMIWNKDEKRFVAIRFKDLPKEVRYKL